MGDVLIAILRPFPVAAEICKDREEQSISAGRFITGLFIKLTGLDILKKGARIYTEKVA